MAQYGLIEAGGTKFVLGIADEAGTVSASTRVPTTTPQETIGAAIDWFTAQNLQAEAIGIGSFGPLDLDRASPTWGHITSTPKPGWSGTDLCAPFVHRFGAVVSIDTDVNGPGW